jgi:hypothetical protein
VPAPGLMHSPRDKDGSPDHGVRAKTLTHHQLLVQVGQTIERNARIPVVLEVIANVARQENDRLEPGGNCGASDRVFLFLALHGAMLADDADVLNRNVPSAIRHDSVE